MRSLPASPPSFGGHRRAIDRRSLTLLGALLIAALAVVVATRVRAPSLVLVVGGAVGSLVVVWMFLNERVEQSLAVLMLYLGLLDGYLKLSQSGQAVTLIRDVLLYAIVLGMLARATIRHEPLRLPPMSGWVLLFVAIVLVQLANPGNGSGFAHALGGARPHLEFVPLFFLGYLVLQSRARLRWFFLLLLVCAVANGIVAFVQLNLSPEQLAGWGPGYAERINGTGDVAARTFKSASGVVRVRPFGLGADVGGGGTIGLLALGGALALVSLAGRRVDARWALLLCVGPPLAILTSQGRTVLLAAIVALLAFVLVATTAERLVSTVAGVLLAVGLTVLVVSFLSAGASNTGVFDRFDTVAPSKVVSQSGKSRGVAWELTPGYLEKYPLGTGLGSTGPAASFRRTSVIKGLSGENEINFLILDTGIPGVLAVVGLSLHLLLLAARRMRTFQVEDRLLVAGLLTGFVGLLTTFYSGPATAGAPGAPFFWLSAGALAYWLAGPGRESRGEQRTVSSSDPPPATG